MKILIIEDEERLARSIAKGFSTENFTVDLAFDGEEGQRLARTNEYDCIILDLMLPKISGLNILRTLRAHNILTPVIILTARGAVEDKIEGLEIGADDYIAKPFSFDELLARVKALVRRASLQPKFLQVGDLKLNPKDFTVIRNNKPINLSRTEFRILEFLLLHRNTILSESRIIEYVWNDDRNINSNVIAAHIKNLRRKIDKAFPDSKPLIKTVRGLGYKISDDEA
ncbi:MAG: DNA-binding response regulator [Candidatus Dojkabacteria bacterium]|nr:MAG: DNA-binding response regulator [Candidatus Dojkabacteria bacterium]